MKVRLLSGPTALGLLLLVLPTRGYAANKMPQLDFANPLTTSQLVWMAAILVILYVALSRWALPRVGQVLEDRAQRIKADLAAAQQARDAAEQALESLNRAIKLARDSSQATIAEAIAKAKSEARAHADAQNARLMAQIAQSEAAIERSRAAAMASLPAIAEDVAHALVHRLTGAPADRALMGRALAQAQK
jgi:F-type H+-transporting ATPase subunit b